MPNTHVWWNLLRLPYNYHITADFRLAQFSFCALCSVFKINSLFEANSISAKISRSTIEPPKSKCNNSFVLGAGLVQLMISRKLINIWTSLVVYSFSLDNFKNIKFHQSINSPNFRISCVNLWYNGTFSFKCGFIVASQSITVILDFFSQITHFCPSIPRFYLKSMNLPLLPRSKSWPKRVIGKLPLN